MPRFDLVKHVNEQPDIYAGMQIDISGLNIHESVRQLIVNCYFQKVPFGMATDDDRNTVYFLPGNGCAVWVDDGIPTLNTFHTEKQFEDCIKLALVAHRKFLGSRQIACHEEFKIITERLNQHNEASSNNTLP